MKVTVCELPNGADDLAAAWERLAEHVAARESDLVLLPEMPFYRWLAQTPNVDPKEWARAVEAHEAWFERLSEMAAATVIGTRPVVVGSSRSNVGFVWEPDTGVVDVHAKFYLPDEPGFWEATWYQRGPDDFAVAETAHGRIGFLICTELWFLHHARNYGRSGAQIVVCPRATPTSTADKWVAGGRTAAVVAGAFCLSSNLSGTTAAGGDFAGVGWIAGPEEGTLLGLTSADQPFLTVEVDLGDADRAKSSYPRSVADD